MMAIYQLNIQSRIKTTKFLIWLLAPVPLFRLFYLALNDNLGANPIEFIERSTGTWALVLLMLTLSMTPMNILFKQAWVLSLRRLLGLWMFAYACLHLTTYVWLDYSFDWIDIVKDIIKHPYVLVGALAFVLTLMLALTSNQKAMQFLKKKWKLLHQLVYVIGILALLHFWWLVKKDVTEPLMYTLVLVILLFARCRNFKRFF